MAGITLAIPSGYSRCRAYLAACLLAALLTATIVPECARAESYVLGLTPWKSLGLHVRHLSEQQPLDLGAAIAALERGEFQAHRGEVVNFGIGARPVWLQLNVDNPSANPLDYRMVLGKAWLERLDVYLLRDRHLHLAWHTGDGVAGAPWLVPGVGFVLPVQFPPGRTELLIRAETVDPLIVPLLLQEPGETAIAARWTRYGYGAFYGFLFAFITYNLILYSGLRDRTYLYYAIYLLSFIAFNMSYTGHAQAWLWPEYNLWQQYVVLVLAIAVGCSGLLFARHFLRLETHAPWVLRWVDWYIIGSPVLMAAFIALQSHFLAVWLAFYFELVFTLAMVLLGILTVRHGERGGQLFLYAALCSMITLAAFVLAVGNLLPVNIITFHGVEAGLMLEAVLLSLAIGSRMREQQQARRKAEQLARIDSLTGLPNRRAFTADAVGIWSNAIRHRRPLSVLVLDIDHFKHINDQLGHDFGDRILVQIAHLLSQSCREGDIPARWGGEEFVMLLPETELHRASILAERIRTLVEQQRLLHQPQPYDLTISIGVAERQRESGLQELINAADRQLYQAKNGGRNRVMPPVAVAEAV